MYANRYKYQFFSVFSPRRVRPRKWPHTPGEFGKLTGIVDNLLAQKLFLARPPAYIRQTSNPVVCQNAYNFEKSDFLHSGRCRRTLFNCPLFIQHKSHVHFTISSPRRHFVTAIGSDKNDGAKPDQSAGSGQKHCRQFVGQWQVPGIR